MPSQTQQAEAPPTTAAIAAEQRLSIAEMTRLMDVAAALRKERLTAEQQLNIHETKRLLRQRLLESARVTGDPVTEAEIDAAIEAYYQRQHAFTPPEPGLETLLASLYVRRGTLAKIALAFAAVGAIWWGVFAFGLVGAKRTERLLDEAYAQVRATATAADELAQTPDFRERVDQLATQAEAARAAGDATTLRSLNAQLMEQVAVLKQRYAIRVVAGESQQSGVDRYYEDESGTRVSGYYLIVQAESPTGAPIELPIMDAETGQTRLVRRWAEQVPKAVYDAVAADKQADGVVDARDFAEKEVGRAEPTIRMTGADGAPLTRGRQITQW